MNNNWSKVTLGEVTTIINGGTPSTNNADYWGGEIVWITTTELTAADGKRVNFSSRTITQNSLISGSTRMVRAGTTLVGTTATIGTCAMASCDLAFNQQISGLTPRTNSLDDAFLFYWIQYSKPIIESFAAGTSFKRISTSVLKTIPVNYPPLPEQKRIVDLISSVDSYIEALQQQLESGKRSRNAVLHELLMAGDDEWVETSLGEIADWGSGGTPKADNAEYYGGAIPWCVIGDLTEGEVWETEKKISQLGLTNSSAKIIDPGSVLLAMYGASIGRTGISAIPMATNQAIAFAKCKEEMVLPKYLLVYLQTQKSKFIEMGQGAAQPNISQTIIKTWPISLPPIVQQKKVIERIESFSTLIESTDLLLNKTKNLRSSLLSELLSGEHEIPASYDRVIGAA